MMLFSSISFDSAWIVRYAGAYDLSLSLVRKHVRGALLFHWDLL